MTDFKRLSLAGAIVLLLLLLFWRISVSSTRPESQARVTLPNQASVTPTRFPSHSPGTGGTLSTNNVGREVVHSLHSRGYAVSLPRLPGLPPDAQPGTPLELWVAWRPPITKQPRIQRLATRVTLERIVPPVVRNGDAVALLQIPQSQIPSVLYGDRYGSLAAVVAGE